MKSILFWLGAVSLVACSPADEPHFSLTGTTQGMADSTLLYLNTSESNTPLDSTWVINHTFRFETQLPWAPYHVFLSTPDFSDYRGLWLEDKPMTLDASGSTLKNAQVSGSETETLRQSFRQILDTVQDYEAMVELEAGFMREHPESILSVQSLSIFKTVLGKERTQTLFEGLDDNLKTTLYGQRVAEYLELAVEPEVGEAFVDFEMADTTGTAQRLSNHRGKVTLLEFWAAWCGPCRQENPNLVKTYEAYHDQGFEVFAVSLDLDLADWQRAIRKDGLPWTHVSDLERENKASLIYGVSAIPTNFLIDENGTIVARGLRGEALDEKLAELLGED